MYWNNPRIECVWPGDQDPIAQSQHDGSHCLFYDPAVPVGHIRYQQTLQDISDWANHQIQRYGIQGFTAEPHNHYDIANIVKLNMWIAGHQQQGIVKPMMLFMMDKLSMVSTMAKVVCVPQNDCHSYRIFACICQHQCSVSRSISVI
jgi:hypothetical protein